MSNFDEFGRDMSLRLKSEVTAGQQYMNELMARFKNMSWADICYEIEEEEERVHLEMQKQKHAAVDQKRQVLYSKGEYELEDGEIIE